MRRAAASMEMYQILSQVCKLCDTFGLWQQS